MMKSVKRQLWAVVRGTLPGVGLALTCAGAYLASLQMKVLLSWGLALAYFMIVLGSLVILAGVIWAICSSMESKVYQRRRRQQRVQIFTTERSSSLPPSYEESQTSAARCNEASEFVVMVDGWEMVLTLAPPLYTQDNSEEPDCSWSWERPPRYSQVEREDAEQTGEVLPVR
ncbi:uncharacterized protein ACB058_007495 [Synchiropus picturatus]